jgi:hypothetical protein
LDAVDQLGRLASSERKRSVERYPPKVKIEIMNRFASTFRVAQLLRWRYRMMRGGTLAPPLSEGRIDTRGTRFRSRDTVDVPAGDFEGHPGPGSIAELTIEGASRSYHLDDGVPYPSHGPVGSAYLSSIPQASGDPDKYLRASAFSGWVLAPREVRYSPERIAALVRW